MAATTCSVVSHAAPVPSWTHFLMHKQFSTTYLYNTQAGAVQECLLRGGKMSREPKIFCASPEKVGRRLLGGGGGDSNTFFFFRLQNIFENVFIMGYLGYYHGHDDKQKKKKKMINHRGGGKAAAPVYRYRTSDRAFLHFPWITPSPFCFLSDLFKTIHM